MAKLDDKELKEVAGGMNVTDRDHKTGSSNNSLPDQDRDDGQRREIEQV